MTKPSGPHNHVRSLWHELWVTRSNDSALALYQRAGFALTGDYQPLPSDPCRDELRMDLVVEPSSDD